MHFVRLIGGVAVVVDVTVVVVVVSSSAVVGRRRTLSWSKAERRDQLSEDRQIRS